MQKKIAPSGMDVTQFTVKEYLRFIGSALGPKEFSHSCLKASVIQMLYIYMRPHVANIPETT